VGGGNGAPIAVTIPAGCGWSAVSNAPWLTVTGGASGTGLRKRATFPKWFFLERSEKTGETPESWAMPQGETYNVFKTLSAD